MLPLIFPRVSFVALIFCLPLYVTQKNSTRGEGGDGERWYFSESGSRPGFQVARVAYSGPGNIAAPDVTQIKFKQTPALTTASRIKTGESVRQPRFAAFYVSFVLREASRPRKRAGARLRDKKSFGRNSATTEQFRAQVPQNSRKRY